MNRKGQQEMVGFVLIVVLVVVGLMVFLVISVRNSDEVPESLEIENLIQVLMRTTSECATVYVPNYDSYEDLFKSCYNSKRCINLDKSSCDYLNESLRGILSDVFASEAGVGYYSLKFREKEGKGILLIDEGNCSGGLSGAQRIIRSGSEDLIVQIDVCSS